MRKLIAAMNMTLDGFCDHTVMSADDEIHEHYAKLLRGADTLLYGRVTYQLMEYWRGIVENPTGNKATDDFARVIDGCSKIVYSRTLESVDWKGAELRREIDADEIRELQRGSGKDLFVGSPSLIVALMNLGLVDELQLGIQPTIVGEGLALFKDITERIDLKLLRTRTFDCGAVFHYYEPTVNR
ncbi:MAG TPA: dihydrofolate reductase family protein [Pyrinomonadaceae bacterium]|nr:dihydrofolate reductase family protein [Pyrinomonadaceae bacterium]